jgi:hypothetical protein
MCEFCHQHGEGKKWYLQAKNYSDDLLADINRRKIISDFSYHSRPQAVSIGPPNIPLLARLVCGV